MKDLFDHDIKCGDTIAYPSMKKHQTVMNVAWVIAIRPGKIIAELVNTSSDEPKVRPNVSIKCPERTINLSRWKEEYAQLEDYRDHEPSLTCRDDS